MNNKLKELLEICEDYRYEVIEFGYSQMNECFMASLKVNELGNIHRIYHDGESWILH